MMSAGYDELNALPPEAFLDPDRFATGYDDPAYGKQQYAAGLKISQESESVHITAYGTWGAKDLDGNGSAISCEGIGYHKNTADLLRGFLDGPAPLIVHRLGGVSKEIKPRT